MANRRYPILPQGSLTRTSFAGGMQFDISDDTAPKNASRLINNMLPQPTHGAVTRRDGRTRKYAIAPFGVVAYDVFRWFGSDETYRDVVYWSDGTNANYSTLDGSGTANTIGGLTINTRAIEMQAKLRIYLNNGADPTQVYIYSSGVTHRTVGLGAGPSITGITQAVGTPTGTLTLTATYSYKITTLYGVDGESNPGAPTSVTLTGSNQETTTTWTASTPPTGTTITGYRIWRKLTSASPAAWDTWYLVDQVSAGTVTYTDGTTAAQNDATVYAAGAGTRINDNLNGPPTGLTGMVWWDFENRAVAWGVNGEVASVTYPQRLWLSDRGEPEVWRTTQGTNNALNVAQYIDIPQQDAGNPIISVLCVGPRLYIFNQYGVRIVFTNATGGYQVSSVVNSAHHGIIGAKACVVADTGEVFYLSTDGLRRIRGTVELAVGSNADSTSNVVATTASERDGNSIFSIITGIPEGLRNFVHLSIYKNMLHIALATSAISGQTPTFNNDVLIYDLLTNGFYYSANRNVNGWNVQNDSGNPYRLISASSVAGQIFIEYNTTAGDEDAGGNSQPINWTVQDFHRPLVSFEAAQLRDFILDATVSNGQVTARIELDGGNQSRSLQFSYAIGGQRYWFGHPYIDTVPSQTCQNLAIWQAVTNGEFDIHSGAALLIHTTALNFSAATSMFDVASIITARMTALSVGLICIWRPDVGVFRFIDKGLPSLGFTPAVHDLAKYGAGTGTDISGATLDSSGITSFLGGPIGAPASGVYIPTRTVWLWWQPLPYITQIVGPQPPTAPTDPQQYLWSDLVLARCQPVYNSFYGERGQLCRVTLTGTCVATVFAYRMPFWIVPHTSPGVLTNA